MKPPKTSLGELRHLFARSIALREIAEPLVSFDVGHPVAALREFMESRGFDVVGVRVRGLVAGKVRRADLEGTCLDNQWHPFEPDELHSDQAPLLAGFTALGQRAQLFVTLLGRVGGIVTRGDLQKAPVRLWLFGLVSLVETQMLRLIRERFPDDAWAALITRERLASARQINAERTRRREETLLVDCLQFGDKACLLMKDPALFEASGFPSRRALASFLQRTEHLRNALAHANDVGRGNWTSLTGLVENLEQLLERLERAHPTPHTHR